MHIVHIISSLERGGAQAVLYDLVRGLAQEGYTQSIIYFHDGPYTKRFADAGIPLYRVQGFILSYDPLALYRLYIIIKRCKPSGIHTILWAANWMGRIVARWLRIPCIASLHNNYDQNGRVRNFLDRMISFSNQAIIAVSDEVKTSFYQFQKASCPLIVIRNGIDYKGLQQISPYARTALALTADHFVIGSVGRFAPVKRYPLLLATFADLYRHYSSARLLIIGTGPEEKNLRALADNLGISHAICWVIDTPAAPYYGIMDCFMLTSEREGISIALLEAMSCGVACVTTYASLQHPVLENMRNGIVVSSHNATLLSRKVATLVTNVSLRKQLAYNAQHTVKNEFAVDSMVTAYDRMFRAYNFDKY